MSIYLLAQLSNALDDCDRTQELINRASTIDPDNKEFRALLGLAQLRLDIQRGMIEDLMIEIPRRN